MVILLLGKPYNLYFLSFGSYFKLGVTNQMRTRLINLLNEFPAEFYIEESFYFELTDGVARTVEALLKNKYRSHKVDNDLYPTEVFSSECIPQMLSDIEEFHYLFNLEQSRKELIDRYIIMYNDEEKPVIQQTKNVKRMYDAFRGKEEYFDELFRVSDNK